MDEKEYEVVYEIITYKENGKLKQDTSIIGLDDKNRKTFRGNMKRDEPYVPLLINVLQENSTRFITENENCLELKINGEIKIKFYEHKK